MSDSNRRGRSEEPQGDLFGTAEPARPAYVPKREHVLNSLTRELEALRSNEALEWSEAVLELHRDINWPHLLALIPPEEAAVWRARRDAELARLGLNPPTA